MTVPEETLERRCMHFFSITDRRVRFNEPPLWSHLRWPATHGPLAFTTIPWLRRNAQGGGRSWKFLKPAGFREPGRPCRACNSLGPVQPTASSPLYIHLFNSAPASSFLRKTAESRRLSCRSCKQSRPQGTLNLDIGLPTWSYIGAHPGWVRLPLQQPRLAGAIEICDGPRRVPPKRRFPWNYEFECRYNSRSGGAGLQMGLCPEIDEDRVPKGLNEDISG